MGADQDHEQDGAPHDQSRRQGQWQEGQSQSGTPNHPDQEKRG